MTKRMKISEINKAMDEINKRRPTKKQIEELGKIIDENRILRDEKAY